MYYIFLTIYDTYIYIYIAESCVDSIFAGLLLGRNSFDFSILPSTKTRREKKSTQLFDGRIIYIVSIGWDIVHCHVWSHDSRILGSLYAPYTAIYMLYIYMCIMYSKSELA